MGVIFTDSSLMPFGKYKGDRLIDVPGSYLLWLYENDKAGSIKGYIEDNLDAIKIDPK